MKVMVRTGETDEEVKNLIGNKVFGYKWDATTDLMESVFSVFLTNKKRILLTLWIFLKVLVLLKGSAWV